MSKTEQVQTQLILDSGLEVAAFPDDWREAEGGVQYLYRKQSILVRDWHLERVREALQDGLPEDSEVAVADVVGSATRLSWAGAGDSALTVEDALRLVEDRLGPGFAPPDHLV